MKNIFNTMIMSALMAVHAGAGIAQDAMSVMEKVNARNEGLSLTQDVSIEMIDRRGKKQERTLKFFRKDEDDQRKSVIFYTSPPNVRGTGFLTYDFNQKDKEDNQWLYLPALRKTRRISSSNRGDYFLGTDLTYEDVKLGSKVGIQDYTFTLIAQESFEGKRVFKIEGVPVSEKVAKELGYGKVLYTIDAEIYMPLKISFWDVAGNALKEIHFREIARIQDIWTVRRIEAKNFKTEHATIMVFNGHDYSSVVNESLFTQESLVRGL